jgi:hypothetical protein
VVEASVVESSASVVVGLPDVESFAEVVVIVSAVVVLIGASVVLAGSPQSHSAWYSAFTWPPNDRSSVVASVAAGCKGLTPPQFAICAPHPFGVSA